LLDSALLHWYGHGSTLIQGRTTHCCNEPIHTLKNLTMLSWHAGTTTAVLLQGQVMSG
jgi:hypothetical protein